MENNKIKTPDVTPGHENTVEGVYEVVGIMLEYGGIHELTEGRYEGDPKRPYQEAQNLQQKHLLKLAELKPGERVLDIGCGHGALLREAKSQNMNGIGITLSERQITAHKNLETYKLNWRDIIKEKPEWQGQFDAICAIGSLEHYVSPEEADKGKKEEIYQAFFQVCRWLLKPGGRLVVTAIHYYPDLIPGPKMAYNQLTRPWCWFGGYKFHLGVLCWLGGAYYPVIGELNPIAEKNDFILRKEEDGTLDYYYTSEYWLKEMLRKTFKTDMVKVILKQFKKFPLHTTLGLLCLMVFQNWNWQFRKQKNGQAPTKLVRYAWQLK